MVGLSLGMVLDRSANCQEQFAGLCSGACGWGLRCFTKERTLRQSQGWRFNPSFTRTESGLYIWVRPNQACNMQRKVKQNKKSGNI